jgi:hypothetical protein
MLYNFVVVGRIEEERRSSGEGGANPDDEGIEQHHKRRNNTENRSIVDGRGDTDNANLHKLFGGSRSWNVVVRWRK